MGIRKKGGTEYEIKEGFLEGCHTREAQAQAKNKAKQKDCLRRRWGGWRGT
eukprot:18043_2